MIQSHVSLRSQYRAGRTDRRRNPAEPGACARHDPAQASLDGQGAGAEPVVRRVSEVLRRNAKAGERNSAAVDFLVASREYRVTPESCCLPALPEAFRAIIYNNQF